MCENVNSASHTMYVWKCELGIVDHDYVCVTFCCVHVYVVVFICVVQVVCVFVMYPVHVVCMCLLYLSYKTCVVVWSVELWELLLSLKRNLTYAVILTWVGTLHMWCDCSCLLQIKNVHMLRSVRSKLRQVQFFLCHSWPLNTAIACACVSYNCNCSV